MKAKAYVKVGPHRRAFPKRKFRDGGVNSSGDDAGPFDSWEEERQREQYGSSPASNVMRGVRTAESAAPPASTLPSSEVSSGLPPAITADDAGPMAASMPAVTPPTPSVPSATAPLPATGPPGATLTGTKSTPGQGNPNFQKNSPQATGMDWRKIAAAGLKGATTGTGALAAIGGAALGSYLKSRNQKKTDANIADYITDYNVDSEDYAKGGEVGPSSSDQRSRPARPMRRPAGPPAYVPPPGSAANFPGGGPSGPQFGQVPGGYVPPPGSAPTFPGGVGQVTPQFGQGPGSPPPGGPPPQSMMGPMSGGPPPGGPPPGGPPPGGPPPGGPPPGGPPPGGSSMGDGGGLNRPATPDEIAQFRARQAQMNTYAPGQTSGPNPAAALASLAPTSFTNTPAPPGTPYSPPAMGGGDPMAARVAMDQRFGGPGGGPPPGGGGGLNRPATPDEIQQFQARKQAMGMAKGGPVEFEGPRTKVRPDRQWGNIGKPAEDLPPIPEKKAKGGVIKRRPAGKKKLAKGDRLPVPMVTDEDMGAAPPAAMMAPSGSASGPAPAGMPMGMAEGGECKKMAEGGVAKLRRGFPNTKGTAKVKKMAKGGSVRGCGAAKKGCSFSGVY